MCCNPDVMNNDHMDFKNTKPRYETIWTSGYPKRPDT